MSLTTNRNNHNCELFNKVIINNDLSCLSPLEKVQHIKNICQSIGLNPLTKPIQLIKFQGKEIVYLTKDATDQLRRCNKISIKLRETKIIDNIYIVTVDAKSPDGREDSSTGAININGLKGDLLVNAIMKAETKAKRRVTLSICGLGFSDESEIDTIPGAKVINIDDNTSVNNNNSSNLIDNNNHVDINKIVSNMKAAATINDLQDIFTDAYRTCVINRDKESLAIIINAKDKRKLELDNYNKLNEETDNEIPQ